MCFRSHLSSVSNMDNDDVTADDNFVAVDEYVAETHSQESGREVDVEALVTV